MPQLIVQGYQVTAMIRDPKSRPLMERLGADTVIADGLDVVATLGAVTLAKPDIVIHQMTSLKSVGAFKRFDTALAATNRLRKEGTENLLRAARMVGASRFIVQSYAGWNYERTGTTIKTEEDPLDPNPPSAQRESLNALLHLERAVQEASDIEGTILRYGSLYGPGTGIALDGEIVNLVQNRKLPLIGTSAGIWSFIHVDDAVAATMAALTNGKRGTYNIVDDDPAPVAEWLPFLAKAVHARPPLRVPTWVGRLAAGDVGVSMMTQIRGASNAKAKEALHWEPRFKSWRIGFRFGLAGGQSVIINQDITQAAK